MASKNISMAVIRRLPKYYRYLGELLNKGVQRISSKELSDIIGFTASQIRQDLNNFGGFGQQGYGYKIEDLHNEIGKILGLDKKYSAILIGAGNLGQAIANYTGFKNAVFGGEGLFFATLTGPGDVWIQSLPFSKLASRVYSAAPQNMGKSVDQGSVLGSLGNLFEN